MDIKKDIQPSQEAFEKFEKKYGKNPMQTYYEELPDVGTLPICGIGCGSYYILIVTGECAGEIWIDDRDNFGGFSPYLNPEGKREKFEEWYLSWLNEELEIFEKVQEMIKNSFSYEAIKKWSKKSNVYYVNNYISSIIKYNPNKDKNARGSVVKSSNGESYIVHPADKEVKFYYEQYIDNQKNK